MTFPDLVTWLQERTALSGLSDGVLSAIAPLLEERTIAAEQVLNTAETSPDGLYILRAGRLENRQSQGWHGVSLLPGAAINLEALILEQSLQKEFVTLSECQFWYVSAETFRELLGNYPEIAQFFSQQLAEAVKSLSSQLQFEQERQIILRPYLVSKARRGVIGKSSYAVRLRSQIKQSAEHREPVLIFGEPGLEKDNLAALIHFSSPFRREPIIQVECSKLQASGAELFGRCGGKPGLIEALGQGTLILNNLQEAPPDLMDAIARLITTGEFVPVSRPGEPLGAAKISQARAIVVAARKVPGIEIPADNLIKVPPLRVRKADLGDYVNYFISLICRDRNLQKIRIAPEALRRLQAYDFPNNLRELQNLIERAIIQLEGAAELTEEIIWPSQSRKKQFRLNLLNAYPELRRFLRSSWWPDRLNYGFTLTVFALVVAILFLGPQTRSQNFALNLFWAWWWPLILLGFPFVGRVWCAVCPFMIYGELTQTLSLKLFPRQLKRWPRQSAEQWGGWFLFGMFALILLWEELWNLENTAYLSACLLLLITAGAMIFSAIFERRFWCRYLCPIGGMNGLFAKLSLTELRAQQGTCSAECTTYQCYKGGPEKGEGQATNGCPLYSHPAQLEDNRDCVLCMTCLKACPHRSVELNLRPPGIELWTTHVPRPYEVALLFLLLNAVFLHHLPDLVAWLPFSVDLHNFWQHGAIAIAALALPTLVPVIAHGGLQLFSQFQRQLKPRRFVELAYGYLPLVLAANLAHYLPLGLGEAGKILPVAAATFGFSGVGLPILVAHPAAIAFLQGSMLLFGILLAIVLAQKIARQPLKFLLPQHLSAVILGWGLWQLAVR